MRIDALYGGFSPRDARAARYLRLLVLGIFVAALLERAWDVAWTSYVDEIRSNSPNRMPLAWAQMPWFAGIALVLHHAGARGCSGRLAGVAGGLRGGYCHRGCGDTRGGDRERVGRPRHPKGKAGLGGQGMIATTLLLLIGLLALSVPVAAVMGVLGLALNQFYA